MHLSSFANNPGVVRICDQAMTRRCLGIIAKITAYDVSHLGHTSVSNYMTVVFYISAIVNTDMIL